MTLLPQHAALVKASAISPAVVQARGYRSVTDAAELEALGFKGFQRRVPALLVPVWGVDGKVATHQLRPDDPRPDPRKPGKTIKYETPSGARMVLDVPPAVKPHLGDPHRELWVTEGARKADSAVSGGACCLALLGVWNWRGTNASGGTTALPDWDSVALNGRPVYLAFDSDAAHKPEVRDALARLKGFLERRGARVRIVPLPDAKGGAKQGLDDYRGAGGTLDELRRRATPDLPPLSVGTPPAAEAAPWPAPLGEAALYGLAGDVVRFYRELSEADPAGILLHFLVEFGAAVGRGPGFTVGTTSHHAVEYALLAGRSARSRKGDAGQPAKRLFSEALGDDWARTNRTTGLSTGEGLIHEVRDAQGDAGAEKVDDPGVLDKRRLIVEPEFARVLQSLRREGNTLSAVLRDAWDGASPLRVMTRNRPLTATRAHIGVVAHTTAAELRRLMTATDASNGFLNRFLCVAVTRSRLLPSPKAPDPETEARLQAALTTALEEARRVVDMRRTEKAEALWVREYARLAVERDGLAGDVLARAEAHVLRLSMLYALTDGQGEIDAPHLRAALELWRYVEESTVFVYGDASGDTVADRILEGVGEAAVAGHALSRTELSALFSRNVPAPRIEIALRTLEATERLRAFSVLTGGRRAEYWTLPGASTEEEDGSGGESPQSDERNEKSPAQPGETGLLSFNSSPQHSPAATNGATPPAAQRPCSRCGREATKSWGGVPFCPEHHPLAARWPEGVR